MNKRIYILVSFLIIATSSFSQETSFTNSRQIKAFANLGTGTSYSPMQEMFGVFFDRNKKFTFRNISLAYTFSADGGSIHELELSQLIFNANKDIGNWLENKLIVSIRYELSFPFSENFNAEHKLKFYYGFYLQPLFERAVFEPLTAQTGFRTTYSRGGIRIGPSFKNQFWVTDRAFIELAVPISIALISSDFTRIEDPTLTLLQQRQGGFTFESLDEWYFRLGFGYAF